MEIEYYESDDDYISKADYYEDQFYKNLKLSSIKSNCSGKRNPNSIYSQKHVRLKMEQESKSKMKTKTKFKTKPKK